MTYKERFVAVVKSNGKILREHDGVVTLPFQSEYSILMKNLESRKAEVRITIDGQDVLNGSSLLVMPNSTFELEGFLSGFKVTNKFKFIKKTKEIIEHRGDKIDDGIIRVEFTYEKYKPERKQIIHDHIHYCPYCYCHPCTCYPHRWRHGRRWYDTVTWYYGSDSSVRTSSPNFTIWTGTAANDSDIVSVYNCSLTNSVGENQRGVAESINFTQPTFEPLDDEGITVKGSESNQKFVSANIGELEENSNVIIIKLRGTTSSGEEVKQAITVDKKLYCETCGKASKSSAKFCSECGTSLI
jgi:hypothetical protein